MPAWFLHFKMFTNEMSALVFYFCVSFINHKYFQGISFFIHPAFYHSQIFDPIYYMVNTPGNENVATEIRKISLSKHYI